MIQGKVDGRGRPMIPIQISKRGGGYLEIEAVVDTGFDGELALPNSIFKLLRSSMAKPRPTTLAGGTVKEFPRVATRAKLGSGDSQQVFALDLGDEWEIPIIGFGLLKGYSIYIEARSNGKVEITPLN